MNKTLLAIALAAAATGSFAQAVQSGTSVPVTSGTGLVVAPASAGTAVSTTTVVSAPVRTVEVLPSPWMSGAVVAQAGSSESVSGNTRTVVTRYWVGVPAGVEGDADFQRWQRLR